MKLYYSPGACSLSPHIIARELGLALTIDKVDQKKTSAGADFWAINPKGYVPALELDDGNVLTENPAIAQYLADQNPGTLLPTTGIARYRVLEMLGYINSEIHKTYAPMFNPKITPELREDRVAYLKKRYTLLEKQLEQGPYLFGEQFTVADAYLFVVTNWANFLAIELAELPNLLAFQGRVAARPAVQEALVAEGLLKK
ncbi:MAG TPA: glutathione transferase GstA [Kofleriaceae bacterium]|nr:glutathione transferase GstA [Kofleriaceae bacterium]